ncbi:MAG: LPXTG cell wall anchor domain-containing protein, partial [Vagococcus sp.]
KTLYPVNSTFLPGVSMTNEQLIAKLKKLQVIEDEAKANGQTLPFGRIAGLLQNDTDDSSDSSSTDSTTSESTTTSTQKDKVTPTSSSNKKDSSLPKTGEKQNELVLATLGLFSILGASYVLSKKS